MTQNPVLIVGAGPTGLMTALELTRYGIPVRIIDRKSTPTLTTNAAGIQTRTIEIFDHIGIVDEFVAKGVVTTSLDLHSEKKTLASIPLTTMDSFYKFILMLPQYETEKILNEALEKHNIHIERNIELVSLDQKEGKVFSSLKKTDGSLEVYESDWVIGCDGYNSTVRNSSGIKMIGRDFDQEFFVADIRSDTPLKRSSVNMFLAKGKLVGLFALPGEDKYRVVGNSSRQDVNQKFSDQDIKNIVREYSEGECQVKEVLWASPFWIHSKTAAALRNKSVFIAGDAAHVHSPAGAQGMNTGLQDAFNLCWKLAMVIQGKADQKILDSYQEERYPIIKNIVRFTEILAHLGLGKNSLVFRLRNFFFKHVTNNVKFLQKKVVGIVTQVALKYKHSSLIDKEKKGHRTGPQAGERAPDLVLQDNNRFYDYLRNQQHNLFLFTGKSGEGAEKAVKVYREIEKLGWIKPYIVTSGHVEVANEIEDRDGAIHTRYGADKPSMCLIRPDQYIGLFVGEIEVNTITDFIRTHYK